MKYRTIYQFKIVLQNAPFPIWRRIQVPSYYSFWDLHVAIQDAMGWEDRHLHEFLMTHPKTKRQIHIGLPDDDHELLYKTYIGWKIEMRDYFNDQNKSASYKYDFGDGWEHQISFEGEYQKESTQKYPLCIAGENACPPEDVGGIPGYERFLKIIADPEHDNYENMRYWSQRAGGKPFDPHQFNPQEVKFDSPTKRWKKAFG